MQVKNGSTVEESYLYDPDGQRVKKVAGSTTSYYPFAHYEISGSTVIKYYYFNGQRIAQRNGSTLYYLHTDHLDSNVVTTSSANATRQYNAYGKLRGSTGSFPSRHQFTGQYIDDSGLYYYNSRYYDPQTGVFISPDTIVPDAGNVFDYNRYMMVRGNPLKYNDPSGHDPCDNGAACGDPSYSPEIQALYDAFQATGPDENYTWDMFYADLLWSTQQTGGNLTTGIFAQMPELMETDFNARHGGTAPPGAAPYVFFVTLFRPDDLYAAVAQAENQRVAQLAGVLAGLAASNSAIGNPGYRMTPDQQALKELVDGTTRSGRKALTVAQAETVLDWADEVNYPGWRAGINDVTYPSNWSGRPGYPNEPHIHIPGVGSGHIPVDPGVRPR